MKTWLAILPLIGLGIGVGIKIAIDQNRANQHGGVSDESIDEFLGVKPKFVNRAGCGCSR